MSDSDQSNEPWRSFKWTPSADAGTPQGEGGIPVQLHRAILLMYAGAVLTLISIVFNFTDRPAIEELIEALQEEPLTATELDNQVNGYLMLALITGLLTAGLWLLMAVLIKRGKYWARVLASTFGVLYVVANLFNLTGAVQTSAALVTLPGLVALATLVVAVLALIFLWTAPVREWFDAMRNPLRGMS